jgi:uncharacterized protein YbbC (DUF1343 family)
MFNNGSNKKHSLLDSYLLSLPGGTHLPFPFSLFFSNYNSKIIEFLLVTTLRNSFVESMARVWLVSYVIISTTEFNIMLRAKIMTKNGNFTNLYKNNSWQKKTINNDDLLASIIKGIKRKWYKYSRLKRYWHLSLRLFCNLQRNSNTQLTRLLTHSKTVSKNKR